MDVERSTGREVCKGAISGMNGFFRSADYMLLGSRFRLRCRLIWNGILMGIDLAWTSEKEY